MRIFLSFVSEDREVAERLYEALTREHHTVFYDRRNLKPGGNYNQAIRTAILQRSELFIFLISPDSAKGNRYAHSELKFAKTRWPRGENVLPVVVRRTDLKKIDPYLSAGTVLEPEGDVVAEVAYEVAQRQTFSPLASMPPPHRIRRLRQIVGVVVTGSPLALAGAGVIVHWSTASFIGYAGVGHGAIEHLKKGAEFAGVSLRSVWAPMEFTWTWLWPYILAVLPTALVAARRLSLRGANPREPVGVSALFVAANILLVLLSMAAVWGIDGHLEARQVRTTSETMLGEVDARSRELVLNLARNRVEAVEHTYAWAARVVLMIAAIVVAVHYIGRRMVPFPNHKWARGAFIIQTTVVLATATAGVQLARLYGETWLTRLSCATTTWRPHRQSSEPPSTGWLLARQPTVALLLPRAGAKIYTAAAEDVTIEPKPAGDCKGSLFPGLAGPRPQ